MPDSVHDITVKTIDGKETPLSTYKGKALLIVNVASRCGYTPQYEGLEALYRSHKERGLVVLGFPANDFGAQEPGTDQEIKTFCSTKYDVTFPMFSKITVKGKDKHPLYRHLTDKETNPASPGEIAWNFTKFLIGPDGRILARFDSGDAPMAAKITEAVEKALEKAR